MAPLDQLTQSLSTDKSRDEKLRDICKTAAALIPKANLVSLWSFDEKQTKICNIISYDAENDAFATLPELNRIDYPEYFEAIVDNEVISASNAREHSMTKCFNESYFEPLNIYSLLDFILHKDFTPRGVICCERRGSIANWASDDIDHLRAISTAISYFFDVE